MRWIRALALAALAVAMTSTSAHAGKHDYYECAGADGAVSYSVTPCEKGRQKLVRSDAAPRGTDRPFVNNVTIISVATPKAQGAKAADAASGKAGDAASKTGAVPGKGVILYATSWCPYCQKARDLFAELGVKYTEYDVEKSEKANKESEKLGGSGVPLIVINGQVIRGFNRDAIVAALKKA